MSDTSANKTDSKSPFANFASQLKGIFSKEDPSKPPPKEMKLGKSGNSRYDPIKKRWLFDDEDEKDQENFIPPPKNFAQSAEYPSTLKRKLYVDFLEHDNNDKPYQPANIEEKIEEIPSVDKKQVKIREDTKNGDKNDEIDINDLEIIKEREEINHINHENLMSKDIDIRDNYVFHQFNSTAFNNSEKIENFFNAEEQKEKITKLKCKVKEYKKNKKFLQEYILNLESNSNNIVSTLENFVGFQEPSENNYDIDLLVKLENAHQRIMTLEAENFKISSEMKLNKNKNIVKKQKMDIEHKNMQIQIREMEYQINTMDAQIKNMENQLIEQNKRSNSIEIEYEIQIKEKIQKINSLREKLSDLEKENANYLSKYDDQMEKLKLSHKEQNFSKIRIIELNSELNVYRSESTKNIERIKDLETNLLLLKNENTILKGLFKPEKTVKRPNKHIEAYQFNLSKLNAEKNKILLLKNQEICQFQTSFQVLLKEIAALREENETLCRIINDNKIISEETKKNLMENEKYFTEMDMKILKYKKQIDELVLQNEELNNKVKSYETDQKELAVLNDELNEKINSLKDDLKKVKELEIINSDLNHKIKSFETEKKNIETELSLKEQELNEKYEILNEEKINLSKKLMQLENENINLNENIASLQNSQVDIAKEQFEQERTTLLEKEKAHMSECEFLKSILAENEEKIANMLTENNNLLVEIENLKSHIKAIEESNNSISKENEDLNSLLINSENKLKALASENEIDKDQTEKKYQELNNNHEIILKEHEMKTIQNETKINELILDNEKIQNMVKDFEVMYKTIEEEYNTLIIEYNRLKEEIYESDNLKIEKETQINELNNALSDSKFEKEELEVEIESKNVHINELMKEIENKNNELRICKQEIKEYDEKQSNIVSIHDERIKKILEESKINFLSQEAEINELKTKYNEESETQKMKEQSEFFEKLLTEKEDLIKVRDIEIQNLKEKNQKLEKNSSKNENIGNLDREYKKLKEIYDQKLTEIEDLNLDIENYCEKNLILQQKIQSLNGLESKIKEKNSEIERLNLRLLEKDEELALSKDLYQKIMKISAENGDPIKIPEDPTPIIPENRKLIDVPKILEKTEEKIEEKIEESAQKNKESTPTQAQNVGWIAGFLSAIFLTDSERVSK